MTMTGWIAIGVLVYAGLVALMGVVRFGGDRNPIQRDYEVLGGTIISAIVAAFVMVGWGS